MTAPLGLIAALALLSGCAVAAVTGAAVGTAVSVGSTVVGVTVDATGALVSAAIPDGEDDDD